MIWITTILMLGIAAVFTRQALREKQQYLELGKDPETMADEGLFMETVRRFAPAKDDTAPTLHEDNSLFAGLVRRVDRSENPVSRMLEKSRSSAHDTGQGLFDRINTHVSHGIDKAESNLGKVSERVRSSSANGGLMDRVGSAVNRAEAKLDSRVSQRSQRMAETAEAGMIDSDSRMGRLVNRVSKGLDKADQRIERRYQAARNEGAAEQQAPSEDFVSRLAGKIGPRVDSLDDRLVDSTRKLTDKGF